MSASTSETKPLARSAEVEQDEQQDGRSAKRVKVDVTDNASGPQAEEDEMNGVAPVAKSSEDTTAPTEDQQQASSTESQILVQSLPPSTYKFCPPHPTSTSTTSTEPHLLEPDVGITEYLSPASKTFTGIVKQRFEDFMVYEVDPTGEVVRLKDISNPKDPFQTDGRKKKEETEVKEAAIADEKVTEENKVESTEPEKKAEETSSTTTTEDMSDIPEELHLAPHAQWTTSTTRTLIPLLPSSSIIALHSLLLEGRDPPRPPPVADSRPADSGWGGMKRKDHVKEEEEMMNAEMDGKATVALSGWEKAKEMEEVRMREQGRDRGRGRGRGRGGMRGGRGGAMGGGHERVKDEREVLSEVITDKPKRTEFHTAIRTLFPGTFETFSRELVNDPGASRIAIKWAPLKSAKQRQNKPRDGDDGPRIPKYIHFTLQKTNRDTQDCLNHISRTLRVDGKSISTCGTKDKRGITVQRVCIQRRGLKLNQIWKAANGLTYGGREMKQVMEERGERGVRIGDLRYSDEYLELGMLKGNHFTITLRNVKAESTQMIDEIMESMKTRGFVNYYGMQRFGTAAVSSHSVGLHLLKGEWKEACEAILSRRPGEHPDGDAARRAYWERNDLQEALKLMPRRNTAERAIWEFWARPNQEIGNYFGGLLAIPRNLRLIYVHAYQSYVWNLIVSERIRMNPTGPIVGDLVFAEEKTLEALGEDAKPDDYRGNPRRNWQTSSSAEVKVLKQEDLASHTLEDVVIPLPGYDITYPEGPLFERYQAIMHCDGLDPLKMRRNQKEYSLEGSYRKIIHIPGELSWKHLRYDDPDISLSQSDEDKILGFPAPKLDNPDAEFAALQVSLTLGTSSYATMALRELTKEDTGTHHQTKMTAGADDQKAKVAGAETAGDEEEEQNNEDDKMEG